MKILDIVNSTTSLLTEANILNVKDPHDGHSIVKYLKHYAKSVGSDVAKNMFVKKIQKLLLNDEKFHFAVRELPDGAPEWAQEALAARDLYFFKPNPTLNNTIEHLTHYIAKMEEDMNSDDANKKAVATKEFAGFPKAESLEMLEKKSNEYFERGGSKEATFEGTKEIYSVGQFKWLKLETANAFRNAGNTLNNCIGSHWTKAKTDNDGESIIVLADNKNALIVAARIKNADNELWEMKGKNNRPPIDQYMPPVAALINKFKLSLSSSAHNDVISAGYYFDDETHKLLTKPQAIKKLVSVDVLGTIAFGLKLVQPKPSNDTEASRHIFSELYAGSAYQYRHGLGGDEIYEGRLENGNPVITAVIESGKLSKLKTYFNERLHDESHLQEAVDINKKHDHVKAFVTELIKRDKIHSIDQKVLSHIFWELKLEWDQDNKQLVDRPEGIKKQLDKKDHKWSKYVDKSTLSTITNALGRTVEDIAHPIKKIFVAIEEVADDRSRNEYDIHLAVIVDSDNNAHLVNASGTSVDEDHVGFKKEIQHSHWSARVSRVSIDTKTIRSIVALAKDEKFNLKTPAMARFGVTGETPEQYKQFKTEWKKIPGDPEAIKADFSHLRDNDRFTAVYSTAITELGGTKSTDAFDLNTKLTNNHYIGNKDNINSAAQFKTHTPTTANKAIGNVDAIYKVDVGYGTASAHHGAMVMVSNKKITKLDTVTEKHNWQGWDDFDKVAETLNRFAHAHGLTWNTDAVTTDKKARSEFRIADGKVTTMSHVKTSELSRKKKKEGVDSLEYSDGWTLHRMTPDEQAKWIRRGIGEGVRGQAWLLKDDAGKKRMVLTILHQRIARMFYHPRNEISDKWPTSYGRKLTHFLPYIKTAMDQFKWKHATTGTMKATNVSHSTIGHLQALDDMADPDNPTRMPGSLHEYQSLKNQGLVDALSPRRFKINAKGKLALAEYRRLKRENPGESVTDFDMMKGVDPHADFKIPGKTERVPAASATPRTTRTASASGVSKASQALDKFRAHVDEHGGIPSRSEFIAYMEEDPFNMSKAGAQTYYYTTKKKYANLNESILGSLAQLLLVEPDALFNSFADLIID